MAHYGWDPDLNQLLFIELGYASSHPGINYGQGTRESSSAYSSHVNVPQHGIAHGGMPPQTDYTPAGQTPPRSSEELALWQDIHNAFHRWYLIDRYLAILKLTVYLTQCSRVGHIQCRLQFMIKSLLVPQPLATLSESFCYAPIMYQKFVACCCCKSCIFICINLYQSYSYYSTPSYLSLSQL